MKIYLVRHGESEANIGERDPAVVGDANIGLTAKGKVQAEAAGARLGPETLGDALVYCSPYQRTRETLAGVLAGAGLSRGEVRVYEDPRLREIELGQGDHAGQQPLRAQHGYFYYRYEQGGESPADTYDRLCTFLESMARQVERTGAQRVVIVTHGLIIRTFAMRFMHLSVEDWLAMDNPGNGEVITLTDAGDAVEPTFTSGRWQVEGLALR